MRVCDTVAGPLPAMRVQSGLQEAAPRFMRYSQATIVPAGAVQESAMLRAASSGVAARPDGSGRRGVALADAAAPRTPPRTARNRTR